jgi:hypothetical protein
VLKKRVMAESRWDDTRRLELGKASNQPKWPYWVQPRYYNITDWHSMDRWVRDTFGDADWTTPGGLWVGSDRKYWFRDKADRTLFVLRWS